MSDDAAGWIAWTRGLMVRRQHLQHLQDHASRLIDEARDASVAYPAGWFTPPNVALEGDRLTLRHLDGVLPGGMRLRCDELAEPVAIPEERADKIVSVIDSGRRSTLAIPVTDPNDNPPRPEEIVLRQPVPAIRVDDVDTLGVDGLPVAAFDSDGLLDPVFVPCCRYVSAWPPLTQALGALAQAVATTAEGLANRLREDGFRVEMATPEQVSLTIRSAAVARHRTALAALAAAGRVTPFDWFLALARLHDDLAALFPDQRLTTPVYDHRQAGAVLLGLVEDSSRRLAMTLRGRFLAAPFERSTGNRLKARLPVQPGSRYFLGLESEASAGVTARVLGTSFRLVAPSMLDAGAGLVGLKLAAGSSPELPARPGIFVFGIDPSGARWDEATRDAALAFEWGPAEPLTRAWLFVIEGTPDS